MGRCAEPAGGGVRISTIARLDRLEHAFYSAPMRAEYREEPCQSALNRVQGMPFGWSLNPYTGCAHRCTFCYVRRSSCGRTGRRTTAMAIDPGEDEPRGGPAARARPAVVEARDGGDRCRDGPVPARGGSIPADAGLLRGARGGRNPFGIITRGPLIVRDIDVLGEAARRADVSVTFSIPTLDPDDLAHDRARDGAAAAASPGAPALVDAGIDASVGMAPILPGLVGPPGAPRGRREGRA